MEIEPIGRIEDLKALRPEWLDLYGRAPSATPFQRPEWLLPWWEIFGSGELFTFAARIDGRLVGLAPMFLHRWNDRRQVTFIGNGVSDHLGFLLDAQFADEATAGILSAVARERSRWDLCDLQDVPADSPLCRASDVPHVSRSLRPIATCESMPLPATWEEFHAALPHGLRRNLRRYRERLDGAGRVIFETAREPVVMAEILDALIDLHRARWISKEDNRGMIGDSALERFHRAAAENLARAGVVRLHAMRLNGRIVAAIYAWIERGRSYGYLTGFDPSLAQFSPGALALGYAIEQSIREGARVFDFLRGEESYKSMWGARRETSYRVLLRQEYSLPTDGRPQTTVACPTG